MHEFLPLMAKTGRHDGITFHIKDVLPFGEIKKLLLNNGFSQEHVSTISKNIKPFAGLTKSEKVISNFDNADYLAFNELHSPQ